MNRELTASSNSAGALFGRFRFQIPDYQREYTWDATDEVNDFFADLLDSLDGGFYFLGLVILTGSGPTRTVVDGQQRLITTSLLAIALRNQARSNKRTATAAEIDAVFLHALDYDAERLVARLEFTADGDTFAYKAILDSESVDDKVIDETVRPSDDLDFSDILVKAYRRLCHCLKLDLDQSTDKFARIGDWARFLKENLIFAWFDHPDAASAYRVFEVVNIRGRDLTPSDLLKNYVLSKTSVEKRGARYLTWKRLRGSFEELEQSSQFPQFIRHVVTVNHGYTLPRDLYQRISTIYHNEAGVELLVSQLETASELYLQMVDPSLAGPASKIQLIVFSTLNQLSVISLRPILLALNEIGAGDEPVREYMRWVVRRLVVGFLGTGAVERRLGNAAEQIHKTGDWKAALNEIQDLTPDRSDFIRLLAEGRMSRQLLTLLHRSIIDNVDVPEIRQDLNLLMIRPRSARDWHGFSDEEMIRWGMTLGNTVLVARERRPRGLNSWADFKTNLLPDLQPADIERLTPLEIWTPDEVKDRGKFLAERGGGVWYP